MTDETRLSQLTTRWSLLVRSHEADPVGARAAMAEFLPRYCAPVARYLQGMLGNANLAEELSQEFALRFVRGDFRQARPERGRFRDYLKSALRHLIAEWRRRPVTVDSLPPDGRLLLRNAATELDDDAAFQEVWRAELLDSVWDELAKDSEQCGNSFYEALRLKADDPGRSSATVAALLTEKQGKPVNAAAARQLLHRARRRFAELLRAHVAATLESDDAADVDEELAELGLLVYCRDG